MAALRRAISGNHAMSQTQLGEDYAKLYWQLANVVTGFAVAQDLASIFYEGSNDTFRCHLFFSPAWILIGAVVVFHTIYAGAIIYCGETEKRLLPASETQLLNEERSMSIARLGAIALFGALFLSAHFAPLTDKTPADLKAFCEKLTISFVLPSIDLRG